jgi:hypothetical protein
VFLWRAVIKMAMDHPTHQHPIEQTKLKATVLVGVAKAYKFV